MGVASGGIGTMGSLAALRVNVACVGTLCLLSELEVAAARAWTLVSPPAVLGVVAAPSDGKWGGVQGWGAALEGERWGANRLVGGSSGWVIGE